MARNAQSPETTPSAGKISGADFAQWFFAIALIAIVAAIGLVTN